LQKKAGFKPGMKESVGDGKLIIIISMTVSSINDRISVRIHVYSPLCHLNLHARNPLSIPFAHR